MGMATDTVCITLMVHGCWIQNAIRPVIEDSTREQDMLVDARDFAIIMWIVMQYCGWFQPDAYGRFNAQVEAAYYEEMDRLGVWEE